MENEELAQERIAICKNCGLYKEGIYGPICNPNLYINIEDKETVTDRPTIGFKRGCGCILNKRVDKYYNHCIVNKW